MAPTISETAVTPKIRAVMLDYGEVLSFVPSPEAIARMARVFHIDPGEFLPIYIQGRGPYDRGDLLPEEYWRGFASQAGVTLDEDVIGKLRKWDIEMWSRTNGPMVLWLESLRSAGVKTAILSNMPSDFVTHVRQNFPWLKHFDHQSFPPMCGGSNQSRRFTNIPSMYLKCPLQKFCSWMTATRISNKLAPPGSR